MSKQLKADLALLFVTVGWGASFILTKNSLDELQPYNFLAIRFLFAFLISASFYLKRIKNVDSYTLKYGVLLGVLLFATYAFQTVGISYTTASKSAFITGFSVVLVPVFLAIVSKKLPNLLTIVSVLFALLGLALITLNQDVGGINIGDIYTGFCAACFAIYIILVGKFTLKADSIIFAIIQIGVVGILSLFTTIVIETPTVPASFSVWINIAILSIVCTSGAYIMQNLAQKYTTATHTALIYTMEPVFAALFAYIVAGEVLGQRGIIGAIMIISGTLLIELDIPKLFKKPVHKTAV